MGAVVHRMLALALLTLVLAAVAPRPAYACGAAYPGGPVMCDYPRKDGAAAAGVPVARLSASYAFTSTTILFGEGRRAELTRHAVFGGAQIPLSRSGAITAMIGAGGIAGGELAHGASRDTFGPGFAGYAGIAGRVLEERGALPSIQITGVFSYTHALTYATSPGGQRTSPRFTAFDVRLGAIAGKTFADVFTPYATARVFGGPVYWRFDGEEVTGTDLYKYQLGGGLALALFDRRVDVFAEGIPLGERGIAAGLGTTFF